MSYCAECGAKNDDDACFCASCGARIGVDSVKAAPAGPVPLQKTITGYPFSFVAWLKDAQHKKMLVAAFVIIVVLGVIAAGYSLWRVEQARKLDSSDASLQETATTTGASNSGVAGNSEGTDSGRDQVSVAEKIAQDMKAPDYVMFPESSNQLLTDTDVEQLNVWELQVARNEIYARHGYIFKKNMDIKSYFENKSWYHENPDFKGADSELNQTEIDNVRFIQAKEKSLNQ